MSEETSRVEDAQAGESAPSEPSSPKHQSDDVVSKNSADADAGLQAELNALREESQKNLDGWQRSRAEFTNYKKRVQKELSEAQARVSLDTLGRILPIVDDFERAIQNIPDDIADNPWVTGTALIMKKFERLLEEHDVQVIDPVGETFDPHYHEAIGTDDSDTYESGQITVTLQKGYVSGERVLRPALVRVAN